MAVRQKTNHMARGAVSLDICFSSLVFALASALALAASSLHRSWRSSGLMVHIKPVRFPPEGVGDPCCFSEHRETPELGLGPPARLVLLLLFFVLSSNCRTTTATTTVRMLNVIVMSTRTSKMMQNTPFRCKLSIPRPRMDLRNNLRLKSCHH